MLASERHGLAPAIARRLFVLRHRAPAARSFRVPFYPITPLLFCATSAYLLYASLVYTGVGALVGVGVLAAGALMLLLTTGGSRARVTPDAGGK